MSAMWLPKQRPAMRPKVGKLAGAGFAFAVLASLLVGIPALGKPAPAVGVRNPAAPPAQVAAATAAAAGVAAADPVTIDLCARTGSVTMPGSVVVPIWGFSLDTGNGCGPAQLPGPQLDVTAGAEVTIHLANVDVPENVSLAIPGQRQLPDTVGVAAGNSRTYTFTASDPGTYLYETGVGDQKGVLMGLHGALIVRSTTAGQAYDTATSAYDTEAVLVLSEIDPALNADPEGFNRVNYAPRYWLIDGKAYPDTATIAVGAGRRLLLRYLNAGSLHHTMALLGMHQRVIARDAGPASYPYDVVGETIPAGSRLDTIATIPAASAVGTRFPLYSRQLHLTNAGVHPGGMLTFIEVNAPATNQPPTVSAGADQTVTQLSANLDGTVTDDGLTQPLTTTWSKISGPGTVTFGDASAVDTTASFSTAGTYVLRLSAFDGQFTASDDVTVTVDLSIHAGDLDGASTNIPGNRWRATVTVTVHDALHGAVSGATVTGSWSAGDTNGRTLSCVTGAAGTCTVTSGRLSRSTNADVTFTVTSVTKASFTYQSSANHDPDGDSNGTSITVNRP